MGGGGLVVGRGFALTPGPSPDSCVAGEGNRVESMWWRLPRGGSSFPDPFPRYGRREVRGCVGTDWWWAADLPSPLAPLPTPASRARGIELSQCGGDSGGGPSSPVPFSRYGRRGGSWLGWDGLVVGRELPSPLAPLPTSRRGRGELSWVNVVATSCGGPSSPVPFSRYGRRGGAWLDQLASGGMTEARPNRLRLCSGGWRRCGPGAFRGRRSWCGRRCSRRRVGARSRRGLPTCRGQRRS